MNSKTFVLTSLKRRYHPNSDTAIQPTLDYSQDQMPLEAQEASTQKSQTHTETRRPHSILEATEDHST